jgi:phosphatidylglycerol:prolipoprotein diacylglycerol transferase
MIPYPAFDPVAFSIGPFFGFGPIRVHWYGIMYLIGFIAGWWLGRRRAAQPGSTWNNDVDDLIFFPRWRDSRQAHRLGDRLWA